MHDYCVSAEEWKIRRSAQAFIGNAAARAVMRTPFWAIVITDSLRGAVAVFRLVFSSCVLEEG